MDTNATRLLTEPNFEFGGEARGTAGETSVVEGAKVVSPEKSVMVYDDRQGLFGGAAIKGGAIAPDDKANRAYYEKVVSMQDILFKNKVKPTKASSELIKRFIEYSKASGRSQNSRE
jgi:lipid-binding SYLF domain-containing protein